MKTEDFLYNDFTLIAHYDHIEAEPETGTSEYVEVQKIEIEVRYSSIHIHTINITPFVSEFCDYLFEDFADKIKNEGQRDFRGKKTPQETAREFSNGLLKIFGDIHSDLDKITIKPKKKKCKQASDDMFEAIASISKP